MMQHLLRRFVFDVPLLNEHAKMPLKVRMRHVHSYFTAWSSDCFLLQPECTSLRNVMFDV